VNANVQTVLVLRDTVVPELMLVTLLIGGVVVWNYHRHRSGGSAVGCSTKGGDFSWSPVGTFRGHQWGPQLATSGYFLMATDKSDVDLLVEFLIPLSLLTRIGLINDLESELGVLVDVSTPTGLKKRCRSAVLAESRAL
jgi:hypothetical protein